jgi:hypothetical protein
MRAGRFPQEAFYRVGSCKVPERKGRPDKNKEPVSEDGLIT